MQNVVDCRTMVLVFEREQLHDQIMVAAARGVVQGFAWLHSARWVQSVRTQCLLFVGNSGARVLLGVKLIEV